MNNTNIPALVQVKDTITVLAGDFVSLGDAAKLIGYTKQTFYRHYKNFGMPPYIKRNKTILYKYDDLVEWMNSFEKKYPESQKSS